MVPRQGGTFTSNPRLGFSVKGPKAFRNRYANEAALSDSIRSQRWPFLLSLQLIIPHVNLVSY